MKAQIKIMLKRSIADPQGLAIQNALASLGFSSVKDVRMGKLIEVSLLNQNRVEAEREVRKMCEVLLANQVIETFDYILIED